MIRLLKTIWLNRNYKWNPSHEIIFSTITVTIYFSTYQSHKTIQTPNPLMSNNMVNNHLLMFSNKMWMVETYFQSICHNYIFNLKWLNLLIILSTSKRPRWLSKINQEVKCNQLINVIFVTQCHFITYLLWVLVHHFGAWHARRWNIFPIRRKSINFKLDVYIFCPWSRRST